MARYNANYVVEPARGPAMQTDAALGCHDTGHPDPRWTVPRTLAARGLEAGQWLHPSDPDHPFLYSRALQTEFCDANQHDERLDDLDEMDMRIWTEITQRWLPIYVPPAGDEQAPQDPRLHPHREAVPHNRPDWFQLGRQETPLSFVQAIKEMFGPDDFGAPHWREAFASLEDLWAFEKERGGGVGQMEATRILQHLMKDRQDEPLGNPSGYLRSNCRQSLQWLRDWRQAKAAQAFEEAEALREAEAKGKGKGGPQGPHAAGLRDPAWANWRPQSGGAWAGGWWSAWRGGGGGAWWGGGHWADRGWGPHGQRAWNPAGPHQGFR